MPSNNQIGAALLGNSGTGTFVGSVGPTITLTKTNASIGTSGTFTCNGVCGTLTTGSLATLFNPPSTWTWNNSSFTTTSTVYVGYTKGGTSTKMPSNTTVRVTSSGVATLSIYSFGSALNGTVQIYYVVF